MIKFKQVFTLPEVNINGIPKYYGISNVNYQTQQVTVHLMPFNFVIMYARFLYQKLQNPNIQDAFNDGYTAGFEMGQQEGKLDAALELKQMLNNMGKGRKNAK